MNNAVILFKINLLRGSVCSPTFIVPDFFTDFFLSLISDSEFSDSMYSTYKLRKIAHTAKYGTRRPSRINNGNMVKTPRI